MDFGHFWEKYFSTIVRWFFGPTFFEKMDLRRVLWPKCQVKKVSYIDPLVMRFSPKSEFLIGNFHQVFTFLVKPYSLFLQYRKSVLKKTHIFGPLFEPCSSCVAVDSFVFRKRRFLEKQDPWKGSCLGHFWQFLSKCPNVNFFFGLRTQAVNSLTAFTA